MEQFRNALRFAVQHGAQKMLLTSSDSARVYLALQETTVNEIGVFDMQSMTTIRDFLFPNQPTTTQSGIRPVIHQGTLQVPQIGTLTILAEWSEQRITCAFYFPGNQELYSSDLAKGSLNTIKQASSMHLGTTSPQASVTQLPNPGLPQSVPPPPQVPNLPPNPVVAASAIREASTNNLGQVEAPVDMFKLPRASTSTPPPSVASTTPSLPSMPQLPQIDTPVPSVLPHTSSINQWPASSQNHVPMNNGAAAPNLFASIANIDPAQEQLEVPSVFSPPPANEIQMIQPFQIVTEEPMATSSSSAVTSIPTHSDPVQSRPTNHSLSPQRVSMDQPQISPPVADDSTIHFGGLPSQKGSVSNGTNPIDDHLKEMVKAKASDMHLTVGQPIIFRKSGDVERVGNEMLTPELMESLLLPTFPSTNKAEFAKNNDTDFAYELKGIGRFRVNVFRNRMGVGAVLRHIPATIISSETLNLPPAVMNFCKLSKGLVLVTGPTGSGKSTTLAAMLDWINRNRKEHILTIEDPIEFVHEQKECLINQREVHKHTTSFARALKAALREDPDIILIGEMRDLETIAIAIETAETGHLVFGTLHTTTAISTVDRIIDQFPADRQAQIRAMLSSSLRGVVTQTLLKKKTGGRIAAQEILVSDTAVAAMIREGKNKMIENHMLTQKAEGNQSLNDVLIKFIQEGTVDAQEAYFKSVDKQSFLFMCEKKGIKIDK